MEAQDAEIAALKQQTPTPKIKAVERGGVTVKQKRIIRNDGGILETHDEQEQYYAADVFERMSREDADGKTQFDYMGYAAPEIIEDTRPKVKKK